MESFEKIILTEISLGNEKIFEQFFLQYQPKIVAFLTGLTHDSATSRDLSQDIFLYIWKNRQKLSHVNSISSYLYQIARYKVFDYFDHVVVTENYINDYLNNSVESQKSTEELLFAQELKHLIDEAINQMPPQRQRVFRLSRELGLSNEEIAQRLDISKRTVENHITTALSTLRKIIYLWIITIKF